MLATWPHTDTLVEFEFGDGTVTTTEDHEFWNVSDQLWQETQHIYAGDLLFTADGATVEAGTLLWDTAHVAPAFDLTIDEIHTYHVTAGAEEVLVHNNNDGPGKYTTDLTAAPITRGWRRLSSKVCCETERQTRGTSLQNSFDCR